MNSIEKLVEGFRKWKAVEGLRPYQIEGIQKIGQKIEAGVERLLYVLPTGGGKSVIFREICRIAYYQQLKIVIVVHRDELIKQAVAHMTKAGVSKSMIGVIKAGHPTELFKTVQVASIATLLNRDIPVEMFDLWIYDEAHHYASDRFSEPLLRAKKGGHKIFSLGVTATPERGDGRGLGDVFEDMLLGPTQMELRAAGYLNPYILYSIDLRKQNGALVVNNAIVENWLLYANGRHTAVFCKDTTEAIAVADLYRSCGISAECITYDTPRNERVRKIRSFVAGKSLILTQVGIITEGFDLATYAELEGLPEVAIGCVQILSNMGTIGRWLQACGRAFRLQPDKSVILDHTGCYARLGMPDDPHVFTLDGIQKRTREELEEQEAQEAYAKKKKTFQTVSGELVEIHPSEHMFQLCESLEGLARNTSAWNAAVKQWTESNPTLDDMVRADNLYCIYGGEQKKTTLFKKWIANGNRPSCNGSNNPRVIEEEMKAIAKKLGCHYRWGLIQWNDMLSKGLVTGTKLWIRDVSRYRRGA